MNPQATDPTDERPLVEVRDLRVEFKVSARGWGRGQAPLRAVDGVSFQIHAGEAFALVGESGCGKTTLGRTIMGLQPPTGGSVLFDGVDLYGLSGTERQAFRRRAQMVFQDPYTSLDPRMRMGDSIAEPLRAQRVGSAAWQRQRVDELLELVGLPPGTRGRFPHAFSGGQRQRVGIARALALEPELIVADEPVSALDVSIQAQVLNLLMDLREQLRLTLVFIAHDLAVVRQIATRVAVMYLGRIVEIGPASEIFASPQHPYTKALLSAVPIPDPAVERARLRVPLEGEVPSPVDLPSGCRFHTRCPAAMAICSRIDPALLEAEGRQVACHLIHPPEIETADRRSAGAIPTQPDQQSEVSA